ncbi:MAG: transcriptional repressor [Campylobacteraceae bacterium]|jgi:Fur family ferric uptake transcriptional regulator|nr:transcriptional repressor [Campylobacteraceae bacterium]
MRHEIKKLFKDKGIKFTVAREMILDILNEAKSPLSYEQIRAKMGMDIDKTTFYRNISLFEEANIVRKFESSERKWYFEVFEKTHAHFVCDSCHSVKCVDFTVNLSFEEYEIKNVIVKGICKTCKNAHI